MSYRLKARRVSFCFLCAMQTESWNISWAIEIFAWYDALPGLCLDQSSFWHAALQYETYKNIKVSENASNNSIYLRYGKQNIAYTPQHELPSCHKSLDCKSSKACPSHRNYCLPKPRYRFPSIDPGWARGSLGLLQVHSLFGGHCWGWLMSPVKIRTLIKTTVKHPRGFFTWANIFKSTCGLHVTAILR